MGIWNEYCLICGGPIINTFFIDNDKGKSTKITKKEYDWMNKLFLISNDNKLLQTTGNVYDSVGGFVIQSKYYIITPLNYHAGFDNDGYGLICHQDCYNLIKKKLNHELVFANVCRILSEGSSTLKQLSKYKPMDKYINQFFEYSSAINEYPWLLNSPLNDKINQEKASKTITM